MKKTITMGIASLLLAGLVNARTWKSADGSGSFEGKYVSSTNDSVTVQRGIKEITFKLELLSDADKKFVKDAAAEAEGKKAAAEFAESDFGKAFGKLQKFDGKKYAKHEMESAPKHILLYYSASW